MNRLKRKRSKAEMQMEIFKTSTPISENVVGESFPSFKRLSVIKAEKNSKKGSKRSNTGKKRKKRKKSKGSFSTSQNSNNAFERQIRKSRRRIIDKEESDSFTKIFYKRAYLEQSKSYSKDILHSFTLKPSGSTESSVSNASNDSRTCYGHNRSLKRNGIKIYSADASLLRNISVIEQECQSDTFTSNLNNSNSKMSTDVSHRTKGTKAKTFQSSFGTSNNSLNTSKRLSVDAISYLVADVASSSKCKQSTILIDEECNSNREVNRKFLKERRRNSLNVDGDLTEESCCENVHGRNGNTIIKKEDKDHEVVSQNYWDGESDLNSVGKDHLPNKQKYGDEFVHVNDKKSVESRKGSISAEENTGKSARFKDEFKSQIYAKTSKCINDIYKKHTESSNKAQLSTLSTKRLKKNRNSGIEIHPNISLASSNSLYLRTDNIESRKSQSPQIPVHCNTIPSSKKDRKNSYKKSTAEKLFPKVLKRSRSSKIGNDNLKTLPTSLDREVLLEEKENFSYPSTSTPFDSPEVGSRIKPSIFHDLSPVREENSNIHINEFSGNEPSVTYANITYGKSSRSSKGSKQETLWLSFLNLNTNDTFKNSTSALSRDATAIETPNECDDIVLFESPPRRLPSDITNIVEGKSNLKKTSKPRKAVRKIKNKKCKQELQSSQKFMSNEDSLDKAREDFEAASKWTLSTENVPYLKHDCFKHIY